jgi:hypothetical protein
MTGKEVQAWLFLIEPGRYRLLSDEQVQNNARLAVVRLMALQQQTDMPGEATLAKPMRDAAIVVQLIPITIDFHKGSWRFPITADLEALNPPDTDPGAFSILMLEGYLEVWYRDVLRRTLSPRERARR